MADPWGPAHLSLAVRGMSPSPTVAINELSDALRRQGRRIHKLGLGQSPFPVPRPVVEALQRVSVQAPQELDRFDHFGERDRQVFPGMIEAWRGRRAPHS